MVELGESSVQTLLPQDLGIGPLFWSVRDAVVVGDATTGRIVLWNPAAECLFGYSAAEAAGMPLENLIPERLRARHRAGLARYAVNGAGPLIDAEKPIAMPALRQDGAEISIELSLTPLLAPLGSIATGHYVLANIRDASERQRVAEANTWLAAILEATPDAIIVAGSDGVIVTVNAQSERLLGYARDELIGRSVDTLLPDRLRAGHAHHRHDFSADPRTRPMGAGLDLLARHKDGREIPVEISLSPLPTPDGLYVVSAIRDVSEPAGQPRSRPAGGDH
jgi:PAS domain S-box-containing protein